MPTLYVYRKASSVGARELSEALGGKRFRGRIKPITDVVKAGDTVICWGESLPAIPGVKILNGGPIKDKFSDATTLQAAGVATIETRRQKPAAEAVQADARPQWEEAIEAAEEFLEIPYSASPVFKQGVNEFMASITKLKDRLAMAPQAAMTWLGRMSNHVGGTDLLNPPAAPDFYVRKEAITEEVRIHCFKGKSIRAGKKVHRAGVANPHAWVRSYGGGWSLMYDGFESVKAQRELAKSAIEALGLDFGAVDLGKLASGKWIVLEVNRAAGLEGSTVTSYATAIQSWLAGGAA